MPPSSQLLATYPQPPVGSRSTESFTNHQEWVSGTESEQSLATYKHYSASPKPAGARLRPIAPPNRNSPMPDTSASTLNVSWSGAGSSGGLPDCQGQPQHPLSLSSSQPQNEQTTSASSTPTITSLQPFLDFGGASAAGPPGNSKEHYRATVETSHNLAPQIQPGLSSATAESRDKSSNLDLSLSHLALEDGDRTGSGAASSSHSPSPSLSPTASRADDRATLFATKGANSSSPSFHQPGASLQTDKSHAKYMASAPGTNSSKEPRSSTLHAGPFGLPANISDSTRPKGGNKDVWGSVGVQQPTFPGSPFANYLPSATYPAQLTGAMPGGRGDGGSIGGDSLQQSTFQRDALPPLTSNSSHARALSINTASLPYQGRLQGLSNNDTDLRSSAHAPEGPQSGRQRLDAGAAEFSFPSPQNATTSSPALPSKPLGPFGRQSLVNSEILPSDMGGALNPSMTPQYAGRVLAHLTTLGLNRPSSPVTPGAPNFPGSGEQGSGNREILGAPFELAHPDASSAHEVGAGPSEKPSMLLQLPTGCPSAPLSSRSSLLRSSGGTDESIHPEDQGHQQLTPPTEEGRNVRSLQSFLPKGGAQSSDMASAWYYNPTSSSPSNQTTTPSSRQSQGTITPRTPGGALLPGTGPSAASHWDMASSHGLAVSQKRAGSFALPGRSPLWQDDAGDLPGPPLGPAGGSGALDQGYGDRDEGWFIPSSLSNSLASARSMFSPVSSGMSRTAALLHPSPQESPPPHPILSGARSPHGSQLALSPGINDSSLYITGAGNTVPSRSLWVGSIPASTTAQDLQETFASYGRIESCRVMTDTVRIHSISA